LKKQQEELETYAYEVCWNKKNRYMFFGNQSFAFYKFDKIVKFF
jgi:hypothetical protein